MGAALIQSMACERGADQSILSDPVAETALRPARLGYAERRAGCHRRGAMPGPSAATVSERNSSTLPPTTAPGGPEVNGRTS